MRLAVVTGANQGIGKEIARALGKMDNFKVILTSRRKDAGEEAVSELKTDGSNVEYAPLDITSMDSITAFANLIKSKYGGKLDVLINNAGFAHKGDIFGYDEAIQTLGVNYHGTANVTKALLEFLKAGAKTTSAESGARIVNICSVAGKLSQVSPELQAKFNSPSISEDEITDLTKQFLESIKNNTLEENGWPRSMYGISKLAETAYTLMLARQLASENIVVNAVCPGYCNTSMTSHKGPRPPAKGAETPVWLATREGNVSELTGGFYRDKELMEW